MGSCAKVSSRGEKSSPQPLPEKNSLVGSKHSCRQSLSEEPSNKNRKSSRKLTGAFPKLKTRPDEISSFKDLQSISGKCPDRNEDITAPTASTAAEKSNSQHDPQESRSRPEDPSRRNRDTSRKLTGASPKLETPPDEISLFKELASISESSDKNLDQSYGCCGDIGDTPPVRNKRRVSGVPWGKKVTEDLSSDDSQSIQTSRISNTSK